jgi:glycine/D-amino acid oxidase-like deaminating enzyme/multidrug transporter EmrE-like cation transporter
MLFLILSILCSVIVGVIFKITRKYNTHPTQIIAFNYIVALALCYFTFSPNLKEVAANAPWNIYIAIGILLPVVFLFLVASIKNVGIVKTDTAQRLSLFIPILAAWFIFKEEFNTYKIIGLIIGFLALLLILKKQPDTTENKWIYPAVVLVGFGIIDILFKQIALYTTLPYPTSLFVVFCSLKKDLQFLKDEFKIRKENGFDVNWLEKWDLEKLGLNALAAIESKTAAVMDPFKLANDLLIYCQKKGMEILDRTNITSIQNQKDKLIAVTENKCSITADHIIHCSGYESTETLKEKVVDLKSTYVIASESLPTLPVAFRNAIFWDTSSPYLYFRATSDNRVIMGGGDVAFKDPVKRDKLLPKKEQFLLKKFQRKFPDIDFKIDYSWAGTFGETKDGLPYFGKPNPNKNEHYVLGFGGNGITFSVIGMNSILDSLNNKKNPDLEYYKFGR